MPDVDTLIASSAVLRQFKAGEKMLLRLREQANYLILDEAGMVVYSAANVSKGYGFADKSFMRDGASIEFGDDYLLIPNGMKGYCLSDEGYAKFAKALGLVGSIDLEKWNNPSNAIFEGKSVGFAEDPDGLVNQVAFRLSSIQDVFAGETALYKVVAPYDDEYQITSTDVRSIEVLDADMNVLSSDAHSASVFLDKDQVVFLRFKGTEGATFNATVTLKDHLVELPYEVVEQDDLSSCDVKGDPDFDPLEPAPLNTNKRADSRGLYVNCNNPEKLTNACLNTVLTRADVTEKDVFFTFEHNNSTTYPFYYGYRVTNVGDEDMFVTVKNLGLQIGGDGSWLGEDEWIKFYNLAFRADTSGYTDSQRANFNAYLGFCGTYESENRQPITFRVPKGAYIYVMGGTTKDSYNGINVFGSADQKVYASETGCSNGAVLFSVRGSKALGQFMAYRDSNAKGINKSEYVTEDKEYGYTYEENFGHQYAGYDTCHGVVDTSLAFHFNDRTPAGSLPVTYTNEFYSTTRTGPQFEEVQQIAPVKFASQNTWVTHINPSHTQAAIGRDMTRYITTDHATGNPIVIDAQHYDGLGNLANIGNWMVDYQDTITLVNQGDRPRKVTYRMAHSGTILTYILDENGRLLSTYQPTYNIMIAASNYGAAIQDGFVYEVTVPAHSVARYTVDYNLLANSNGHITHTLTLK